MTSLLSSCLLIQNATADGLGHHLHLATAPAVASQPHFTAATPSHTHTAQFTTQPAGWTISPTASYMQQVCSCYFFMRICDLIALFPALLD